MPGNEHDFSQRTPGEETLQPILDWRDEDTEPDLRSSVELEAERVEDEIRKIIWGQEYRFEGAKSGMKLMELMRQRMKAKS